MNSVDMQFTAGIYFEDVRIHLNTLLLDLSFYCDKCIDFANNVWYTLTRLEHLY
jgi:hypothetical protein